MKIYTLDRNTIETLEDGTECRIALTICHYESIDSPDTDSNFVPLEEQVWSSERIMTEFTANGVIGGIPAIELRRDRLYPDGRIERLQTLAVDPVSMYALYQHLKMVDEQNPDGVFW